MRRDPVHKTPEQRKLRSRQRRESRENEKVAIGLILAPAIIGCLIILSRLDVGRGRTFAGLAILCVAVPTITFFVLYDPFWNFVRRLRKKNE